MPKVTLEFEVIQKGVTVKQVVGEAETAMARLKQSAGGTMQGLAQMGQASDRAHVSLREMRGGLGLLTMSLADQAPQLSGITYQFAQLGRLFSTLGPVGATAAIAVLGLTARVVGYIARQEEMRQRQEQINRAMRETDLSGMTGQLRTAAIELDDVNSSGETWIGWVKQLPTLLFQGVTAYDKAREKLEEYQQAVEKLAVSEGDLAKARFTQQQVPLDISGIEAGLGRRQQAGIMRPTDILQAATEERRLLLQGQTAAKTELEVQAERAKKAAYAVGLLEDSQTVKNINQKLAQDLILLREQTALKIDQIEGQSVTRRMELAKQELADQTADLKQRSATRAALAGEDQAAQLAEAQRLHTQLLALLDGHFAQGLMNEREYQGQRRQLQAEWVQANAAALTKATADYKNYTEEIKKFDRQMAEAKSGTADLLASIKQAGMTPAEAFADKERMAQEHLASAMNLSGQEQIDALKKVQQEYGALALEAARSSDQQVAAAKAVGASLSDLPGEAFQSNVAGGSEAWKQFWGKAAAGAPGSAEWWAWDARRGAMPQGWTPQQDVGAKAMGDAKALADKVMDVGKKLEEAYAKAKEQAQGAANSAKEIADQSSATLTNLQKSAAAAADLAAGFDAAARAARELTSATLPTTLAQLAPSYGGRAASAGLPAELRQALQGAADQIVQDIRSPWAPTEITGGGYGTPGGDWGEPGNYGGYEYGGVVPGPIGSPQPVKAHGGEIFLNPKEQDVVRELTGAARGGPRGATIIFEISGREIARATIPDVQQLIADRIIRVK